MGQQGSLATMIQRNLVSLDWVRRPGYLKESRPNTPGRNDKRSLEGVRTELPAGPLQHPAVMSVIIYFYFYAYEPDQAHVFLATVCEVLIAPQDTEKPNVPASNASYSDIMSSRDFGGKG